MPLSICPAGRREYAALAELHGRCLDPAWSAESVSGLFNTPGTLGLIARLDSQPVGFALCRRAAEESEILAVGVVAEKRRRGVARALLDAAVAMLVADGVQFLFLEVAEDNVAARALYTAAGFTAVGRRADYYRNPGAKPVSALVLRRDITSCEDS
ncbi:MAG: GNAT family N-acetyltransferase [Alphaproteobacteria bacterium]